MDDFQKQKIQFEIEEKEVQAKEFLEYFTKPKRYALLAMVILAIPLFFISKYATAALYDYSYSKRAPLASQGNYVVLPVKILEAQNLEIAGNSYSSYALVKNQNKDLSAPELNYTFHLLNNSGKELAKYSDKTFLLPGEQKYIILPHINLTEAPTQVKVEIQNPEWQKRLDLPNVILKTGIPAYGDALSPDGFFINGNVENTSNYNLRTVRLKAVVFDKNQKVIAVTQYDADSITSKETRSYKMFWPVPLSQFMSGSPLITAETNTLDRSNLQ